MTRVLALDLAKLTGWAVGSQAGVEGFGVHEFPSTASDRLGEYGMAARVTFRAMLAEVEPDEVVFEAPILRPGKIEKNAHGRSFLKVIDTPAKLRKIYCLPFELEVECWRAGIKVEEVDMSRVRRHFLFGKVPRTSDEIKLAVKVMARMRGWAVRDDNEADALATLDYQLAVIDPSWAAKLAVLKNWRWAVGSIVELRSGCVCRITSVFSASYKDGRTGRAQKLFGWCGRCIQHGTRITWQDNGDYSPVGRGHELDVIGLASKAAIARAGGLEAPSLETVTP